MITHKAALRLLARLAGVIGVAAGQRAPATIASISGPRRKPRDPAVLKACRDVQEVAAKTAPTITWGCFEGEDEPIPGTSLIRLNLGELEAVEVVMGKETRRITREALWKALEEVQNPKPDAAPKAKPLRRGRLGGGAPSTHGMSAEGRAAIAQAQRRRWAKYHKAKKAT